MSEEKLIPFTDNFKDNSSEKGFQFTFFCDNCQEGYKTKFVESENAKKSGVLDTLGDVASTAGILTGNYHVGYGVDRGTDSLSDRYSEMSAAWRKEHQEAFKKAQNETKGKFNRCPKCTQWVCDNCWNEDRDLCIECAPREGVEVEAAKAEKMTDEIEEMVEKTQVFDGDVEEEKETICPSCGKPAGQGNFCTNCGAELDLKECPKCGAECQSDQSFCGECGTQLT